MSDKFIWAASYSARTKRNLPCSGARGSERRHVTPRDKIAGNSGACIKSQSERRILCVGGIGTREGDTCVGEEETANHIDC